MELIRPNKLDEDKYFEYLNEVILNNETKLLGDANLKDKETFDEMLTRTHRIRYKENLIGMMRPTSVFWIKENNKIVGSMNLREELSEFTYYTIGNVGYYIRPSCRNKNYATLALSLAKEYYKSIGVKKILLVCTSNNIASEKVIIHNGGELELEMLSFDGVNKLKRYWIKL